MVAYTIVPRNLSYRVEAIDDDGSRRTIGWYKTEDEAVTRLRGLQEKAGIFKPRFGMLHPKDRY